ncbi:hypothetical protein ABH940_001390 [Streptacidiphilus sp. BW17]|uniref:hypothetical protein n=1 Tax=Streptacidiphilus sp. BW17 TaxID=3156274 RepID=UPI00351419AD
MNTDAPEAGPAVAGEETFQQTWLPGREPESAQHPRPALAAAPTPTPTLEPKLEPEPIYADLSRVWVREGRTVPGVPDQEWQHLARAAPRFFTPPLSSGLLPGPRSESSGRHRRDPDSGDGGEQHERREQQDA